MRLFILILSVMIVGCHPYKATVVSKGTDIDGSHILKCETKKFTIIPVFTDEQWEDANIDDNIWIHRRNLEVL